MLSRTQPDSHEHPMYAAERRSADQIYREIQVGRFVMGLPKGALVGGSMAMVAQLAAETFTSHDFELGLIAAGAALGGLIKAAKNVHNGQRPGIIP